MCKIKSFSVRVCEYGHPNQIKVGRGKRTDVANGMLNYLTVTLAMVKLVA